MRLSEVYLLLRKKVTKPIKRSYEKLGRNEPCWCGSGKKYKKCHWSVEHTL